ncbi:MAG: type II secretion system F family protein [Candidatus Calescibacterium sp.]|nr:type II secretion system F family protein [Candidatus Calescibacterium sp.]MCX7734315.1 type II secretion system F family protein [bacterium]MDW8087147.1 type II secretion system F family protein [Candidatus Calescibacterium sp.]
MLDTKKLQTLKNIYLYIDSGFSIEKALEKSSQQMFENLQRGLSLSEILKNSGFPEFVVQNIKIGEETGKIKDIIKNIITILEDSIEIQKSVRLSILTPYITLSLAILILFFTITFVIPEIHSTVSQIGVTTSGIVKIISDFGLLLREYLYISSAILVLSILAIGYAIFFRKIPIFRDFIISFILKSISICLKNGIELQRAFPIVSETVQINNIREELIKESVKLMKGQEPDFSFVPDFSDEIKRGYETGKLDTVLEKVSEIIDQRTRTKVEIIKKIIEPLFFIVIASIIVFIVIFIYGPLVKDMMKMI